MTVAMPHTLSNQQDFGSHMPLISLERKNVSSLAGFAGRVILKTPKMAVCSKAVTYRSFCKPYVSRHQILFFSPTRYLILLFSLQHLPALQNNLSMYTPNRDIFRYRRVAPQIRVLFLSKSNHYYCRLPNGQPMHHLYQFRYSA